MHRMRWPSLLFVVGEISFRPPENTSHPVIPSRGANWSWESAFLSGRRTGPVIRVGAAADLLLSQFPVPTELRPQLLHTRKEVQKPSVSGGSFAYFSSCWEKWAAGGTFLSKLPTGEKIHKEGTDSHDQSAPRLGMTGLYLW